MNYYDIKYLATIYVGSDLQEFKVHMDTGSNKLIMLSPNTQVSSEFCDYPARFDASTSTTFFNTGLGDKIRYLDGSFIRGVIARDTVSIDASQTFKATSFQFLFGTTQGGFECDDGLIGMARMNGGQAYPQFIDQLYTQGKIGSKVFSMYLAGYGEDQSTLQLGGYDTSYLKLPANGITYVPLTDYNVFWAAKINAVRVGLSDYDSDGITELGWTLPSPGYGILDSGTSLMLIPQNVFPNVMKALLRNVSAKKSVYGYYTTYDCDPSQYDTLYLQMGSHWFGIPPQAFIYTFSDTNECVIGFKSMQGDIWLIGDVFLRSYYSVWDHDNDSIGLSPHKTSHAEEVTLSSVPLPVNQFQYTTIFDVAWEVIKVAWKGAKVATAIGSIYFLADVVMTNLVRYLYY
ncbi:hypothetical protein FGO68_gene14782 [Halteria grandinella]|uniref:Peptidase A1 domain-containing protein n=1 Tax=Halteria grandinella TaxID=5974 RepID=A0A8J8T224_HALGN|nr:hypothetical protein FGO68_gene14782 [Halteria grandinella]